MMDDTIAILLILLPILAVILILMSMRITILSKRLDVQREWIETLWKKIDL